MPGSSSASVPSDRAELIDRIIAEGRRRRHRRSRRRLRLSASIVIVALGVLTATLRTSNDTTMGVGQAPLAPTTTEVTPTTTQIAPTTTQVAVAPAAPIVPADVAAVGRPLIYSDGGDIWSMNPDGSNRHALLRGPTKDTAPALSPDGTRIAFVRQRDGTSPPYSNILVMHADGTNITDLSNGRCTSRARPSCVGDSSPAWSPDGTRLAFTSTILDSSNFPEPQLFVMKSDGSGRTRLTDYPGPDTNPSWSSTNRIAFYRVQEAAIYVIEPDGSGLAPLAEVGTTKGGIKSWDTPSWSPDGKFLAFRRFTENGSDIWVVGADGAAARQVTNDTFEDATPVWSPDGRYIAYEGEQSQLVWDILIMRADGTGGVKVGSAGHEEGNGGLSW